MAISATYDSAVSLEFGEFIEYADKYIDMRCVDSVFALGEQLSMLGNNREFLSSYISDFIKTSLQPGPNAPLISSSFILAKRKDFYFRANFWLPSSEMTLNESLIFAYDQAHDHNFDLLTYAYCGDGYVTDIYEYNYAAVSGYIGESVDLLPLGRHKHNCGDVLLYRCNKDIHFQRPPDDISITLNVIPTVNQDELLDQYFFDIDSTDSVRGRLSRHATTNIETRRHLFEIAGAIGGKSVTDSLELFAADYPCGRTRYEALRALGSIEPETHMALCRTMRDDKAVIVRQYAREVLERGF